MRNVWRVLAYEYLLHIRRKGFIIGVLSMPLIVLAIIGVGLLSVVLQFDSTPVGYIDYANLMQERAPEVEGDGPLSDVQFIPFEDAETAKKALDAGEIQAYYVVEQDYVETGQVRMVANERPGENVNSAFSQFLRDSLIQSQAASSAQRLVRGDQVEVRSLDGERQMGPGQWLQLLLPFLAGFLFILVINTSGGYLLQAVVEEKENRTMEIMVTSVSPGQLMGGKIIGNLAVGLTQMLIWFFFPLVAFLLFGRMIPGLDQVRVEPMFITLMLLTLLPAFVLVAALMATIGATATESREAQQIAGLFTLPISIPFYFVNSIMTNPNGPLAVGLSIFPLTAPISLPMRAAFTILPMWQMVLSVGLLVFCAALALWFSGRAFRLGMLQYGKRLSLKELFGRRS